jgi:hypothetical protein
MEGMSPVREDTMVVNSPISSHKAVQIGFDEALVLVKKYQGTRLIRTKRGSFMVRLADGSVLGVKSPVERPDSNNEDREKCGTNLIQEINRLNKVILINKNTLDRAYQHIRDKDVEIMQLKNKLEKKQKETYVLNRIIIASGNIIVELKTEIKNLNNKFGKISNNEMNKIGKSGYVKNIKTNVDCGSDKKMDAAVM